MSKERKARFRTCGCGLVTWRDRTREKKADMKEGYRPAAAKKRERSKVGEVEEAEGIPRQTTAASGAVLELILGPSPRAGEG